MNRSRDEEAIGSLQRQWSESGLAELREMLPLMSPLGRRQFDNPDERRTLAELASATARTSESAMLLCAYGQLWDAEMLVRSTLEGSLKFCYLLQAPETFAERHQEYSRDLFDIGLLRDHQKLAPLLAGVTERPIAELRPLRDRLLDPEQQERIKERLPRTARASLESRWGFTGMIAALEKSGDPLFAEIAGTAHGYSMASHIMHADPIGSSIPLERDHRSQEAAGAAKIVHLARLILDVLDYHRLRLLTAYRFVGTDLAPLGRAEEIVTIARKRHRDAYDVFLAVEYPEEL